MTEIYTVVNKRENEIVLQNYHDDKDVKEIRRPDKYLNKAHDGDVFYQDDDGRWLIVDTFPILLAKDVLKTLTKNGSIKVKDLSEKDKKTYLETVDKIEEYFKDPKLLNEYDTLFFLTTRDKLFEKKASTNK